MRNLPANLALLYRAALAAGPLILLAAVALALLAQPAQGQESAEPTATPTPERREGYEERLAARLERYWQARAAKEGASGTASTGLIASVDSPIPWRGSGEIAISVDSLDTDLNYRYSIPLRSSRNGLWFHEECKYRTEVLSVPAGEETHDEDVTYHGCTRGTYTITVQLIERSIGENEEYLLETDSEEVIVNGEEPTATPTPTPTATPTPTPTSEPTPTPTPTPEPEPEEECYPYQVWINGQYSGGQEIPFDEEDLAIFEHVYPWPWEIRVVTCP